MTSTIVISTYNGEKYIIEQLDSLKNQTLSPDYVLISDDCSTDSTPQIIKDYIKDNNLKNWTFEQNKENQGWRKNFHNLLLKANTDVIFLCDQDDIWHPKKLEIMMPYFNNPEINLLCCNQKIKKDNFNFNFYKENNKTAEAKKFTNKFMWPTRPGCAYAVRKEYFLSIDKWWVDYLPHDAFLFRNAMLDDSLYFIEKDLIIRRMHDSNASIPKGKEHFKISLDYYYNVCDLLQNRLNENNTIKNKEEKNSIIENARHWLNTRKAFYEKPTIIGFIKLFHYYDFYIRFRAFVKELFIANSYKEN